MHTVIVHGTTVALESRALLIRGESGQGKSALALEMLAYGASLIADDRTCLARDGDVIMASAPTSLPSLIEARGIGLLNVTLCQAAPLVGVLELNDVFSDRLPPCDTCNLLGVELPLFTGRIQPHHGAAMIQFLKAGRHEA